MAPLLPKNPPSPYATQVGPTPEDESLRLEAVGVEELGEVPDEPEMGQEDAVYSALLDRLMEKKQTSLAYQATQADKNTKALQDADRLRRKLGDG
jgi:hypothetical protein